MVKPQLRVLMVGLDSSGKTAILYKLKSEETVNTNQTNGYNVEEIDHSRANLIIWDVGGNSKNRPLWRHYVDGVDALIFVIDSTDFTRLDEAREALNNILEMQQLEKVPVLIWANKQDLPKANGLPEIMAKLGLSTIRNDWNLKGCSATKGDGLREGLDWIIEKVPKAKSRNQSGPFEDKRVLIGLASGLVALGFIAFKMRTR